MEYKNGAGTVIANINDCPELIKRIFVIKIFGIVGILFTIPFGFISLFDDQIILSLSLFTISFLLAMNYIIVTKKRNYALAANIIVYVFLFLFLFLVYSGGIENTGSLWIYAFPAIALFLHGLKKGLIDIAIFLTLLTVILLGSHASDLYSGTYQLRLVLSFILVTFLSSLYEYSSTKSFNEMRILTEKLIGVAKQDQLTELANRRGIYEEMELLYAKAKENDEPLCVMLCDIDYLHDINDGYGHHVGDIVIKEIAKEIQNSIKNSDPVARWSGEEFLVILPQTSLEDAHNFAKALSQRIDNLEIKYDNKCIPVSLSIGVSDIENAKSIYAAVRYADNEMYKVKNEVV